MERLKTQLEAFEGKNHAQSRPRKSSGNRPTVVPAIAHDSLDESVEGPDVDSVAKEPDVDPVAIKITPAGLEKCPDDECDENDDLQTRLQTLADETTGITDVSIASFVSDASDTSAFRPLRQGGKCRGSSERGSGASWKLEKLAAREE